MDARVVLIGKQSFVQFVWHDSTEEKKLEELLDKLNIELEARVGERTDQLMELNAVLQLEIASRKKAEEALKESEERYRVAIECGNDGVVILRGDRIIYANAAYAEMFGFATPEEMIGIHIAETVHPDDRERFTDHYRARLAGQTVPIRYEVKRIKRDGTPFYVEASGSTILHHGERLVIGFLRDITKRRQAEEALREKQEQLATLIERSPVALAAFDMECNKVTTINKNFVGLFGYTMSDLPTVDHWWPFAYPDEGYREEVKASWMEKLSRERAEQMDTGVLESVVTCKDGSTRHIEWRVAPLTEGYVASGIDLTEIKRTEAALSASEEKYRSLVESLNEGICLIQDGLIKFVNRKMLEWSGYQKEELVSKSYLELIHPDDRPAAKKMYGKRLKDEAPEVIVYRLAQKTGEPRWCELKTTPLMWEGRPAHLYIANDITERKETEELIGLEHDLAMDLACAGGLAAVLPGCLAKAIEIAGLDSGGIYLVDPVTGKDTLFCAQGVSDRFREKVLHIEDGPAFWALVTGGVPIWLTRDGFDGPHRDECIEEGFRSVYVVPFYSNGAFLGSIHLASHARDEISERRRNMVESIAAQIGNALQRIQNEEKYRAIFENALEGIFQVAPDGRLIRANAAMAKILGCDSVEELQQAFALPGQGASMAPDVHMAIERRLNEQGSVRDFEVETRRANGAKVWLRMNVRAVNINGNTVYEGTMMDITQRKEAENALAHSENKYRNLVESSLVGVYKTDFDGNILYSNEALSRILDYVSPKELMTVNASALWAKPNDRKDMLRKLKRAEGIYYGEARFIRRTGRIVDTLISAKMEGDTLSGMIVDITVLKQMEREIKAKSVELEEMNATLKVLLEQREKDKIQTGEMVSHNVKELIMPYMENLNSTFLTPHQKTLIDLIERSLHNIISPFVKNMHRHYSRFTPSELKVANFIREGKTVKEISAKLGVSESAVHLHSQHVRNKLGLKRKKVNLRTYLQSLAEEQQS